MVRHDSSDKINHLTSKGWSTIAWPQALHISLNTHWNNNNILQCVYVHSASILRTFANSHCRKSYFITQMKCFTWNKTTADRFILLSLHDIEPNCYSVDRNENNYMSSAFTQLNHLLNGEVLIGIDMKNPVHGTSNFWVHSTPICIDQSMYTEWVMWSIAYPLS